jgi:tetratricopeptide (TPR) repeat protein
METTSKSQAHQRLERFLSFLSHDPENVALVLDAIRLSIEIGELEIAESLLNSKHDLCCTRPEFYALAGQVFLIQGRFEEALDMQLHAVKRGYQQPGIWLDLAHTYHYLTKPESAIEVLEQNATQLKELYPSIFYPLYARLLYIGDNSDKAIEQLEIFHADHEATAESAGLLSLILFEEDRSPEQALQLAGLALTKNPQAIEALIARTSIFLSNGQYERAEFDISKAVEYHPQNGRAWSSMAQVEFSNFKFDKARDAARTAVTYMKDHIGTWHLLAWAHLALNEMNEALEAFKQSYELDRSFAETHGGLAAVYAHLGMRKEALHHIKLAEKLSTEGFAAIYAKMVLLRQNNEAEKADGIFRSMQSKHYTSLKATPKELIERRLLELAKTSNPKSLH